MQAKTAAQLKGVFRQDAGGQPGRLTDVHTSTDRSGPWVSAGVFWRVMPPVFEMVLHFPQVLPAGVK
jgi:hypothetical protein